MLAIRIPLALASGLTLCFAVFLGLWRLVGAELDVGPRVEARAIEFSRLIPDTPPESRRPTKPTREPPTLTPRPGIRGPGERGITDGFVGARPAPPIERGKGLMLSGSDRDIAPIIRVPPQYPPAAAARDIEGWVRVQFSVTATGSVRDAVVVASEPGTVFDEAALAAVSRWRYNPRIDRGVAVERVGLQTVLRFALED